MLYIVNANVQNSVYHLYQVLAREQVYWSYPISYWPHAGTCCTVSPAMSPMFYIIV